MFHHTHRSLVHGILFCTLLLPIPSLGGPGFVDEVSKNFTLYFNYEFDPSPTEVNDHRRAIEDMSARLCDATDGQMQVERVVLRQGGLAREFSDFWLTRLNGRSNAALGGIDFLGAHANITNGQVDGATLVHELGHYGLYLGDQYAEGARDDGEEVFAGRGACPIGPGFEDGTMDARNHSIMQSPELDFNEFSFGPNIYAATGPVAPGMGNHDRIHGVSDMNTYCPPAAPTAEIEFSGTVDGTGTLRPLDTTNWATAETSAIAHSEVPIINDLETPGLSLHFYLIRTADFEFRVTAGIDGAFITGMPSGLVVLEDWDIVFETDGVAPSFNATPAPGEENPAVLDISGFADGASDLSITIRFDRPDFVGSPISLGDDVEVADNYEVLQRGGRVQCRFRCAERFDTATGTWATTHQSLVNTGRSDWQTIVDQYGLMPPAGAPAAAAPSHCAFPPNIVDELNGNDQVILVIDRSGSMRHPMDPSELELCDNGIDDDMDGARDEDQCTNIKLDFVKGASSAFTHGLFDPAARTGVDFGLITFNGHTMEPFGLQPLDGIGVDAVDRALRGTVANGSTSIGRALRHARETFVNFPGAHRSRAVLLMSDGWDNDFFVSPVAEANALRDEGIHVYAVPAGETAARDLLTRMAELTSGAVMEAMDFENLPARFMETAIAMQGDALSVPPTRFNLAREPHVYFGDPRIEGQHDEPDPEAFREFPILVEDNADTLTTYINTRNSRIANWNVKFELLGPDGEHFSNHSLETVNHGVYKLLKVIDPTPGKWLMRIFPVGDTLSQSTFLASVSVHEISFFADSHPKRSDGSAPVTITANPYAITDLAGDVTVTGEVIEPGGAILPITLERDPLSHRGWQATIAGFTEPGLYRVMVTAEVGDTAVPLPGEAIFPGERVSRVNIPAFVRHASTTFHVDAEMEGGKVPVKAETFDWQPDYPDIELPLLETSAWKD